VAYTDPITISPGDTGHAADWNTYIRDNLRASEHVIAFKSSDTSTSSDIILNDDPHLTFAIAANAVWRVTVHMMVVSAATPGWSFDINGPAGMVVSYSGVYNTFSSNVLTMFQTTGLAQNTQLYTADTAIKTFVIPSITVNGGTAGTWALRWSQANSSATTTTLKAYSCLIGARISP